MASRDMQMIMNALKQISQQIMDLERRIDDMERNPSKALLDLVMAEEEDDEDESDDETESSSEGYESAPPTFQY